MNNTRSLMPCGAVLLSMLAGCGGGAATLSAAAAVDGEDAEPEPTTSDRALGTTGVWPWLA